MRRVIPQKVLSTHDDYWADLTEFFQEKDIIRDDERLLSAIITLDGENGDIVVEDFTVQCV